MPRQLSFGFPGDQPSLPGMSSLPVRYSSASGSFRSSPARALVGDSRQLSFGALRQSSFNFSKLNPWARQNRFIDFFSRATRRQSFGQVSRGLVKGLPLELALGAAFTVAGAIRGGAAWGAPTGLPEDYVGGTVYGGTKAFGSSAGAIVGGTVGATIGALGGPLGSFLGAVTGGIVGDYIGGATFNDPARRLGLAARSVVKTARAVDRVQFGGNFMDSQAAYTMRQMAVQEMSGSLLNARQFLGNEASFLHS